MAHTTAVLIIQYEAELANIHASMLEIEKRQQIAEQPEAKQIEAELKQGIQRCCCTMRRELPDATPAGR